MAVVSGGTTLIDNGALDAAVSTGSLTLLSTQTASSSSTISFTSGIDSTYDEYVFKFYDIHPENDNTDGFEFNVSIDGGSNYNVAKTTTFFQAYNKETGDAAALEYLTSFDLAQGTGFQTIGRKVGNDNDQSCAGTLTLFSPSSTTFVKHFLSQANSYIAADYSINIFVAGYANTTSAVNAIQFKMSAGNIDSGTIKMYGVK